ncbi:MAG TPA: hypothetical protein VNW72_10410 [Chthoniobacterales bacterium]|jgi:hypothetical protein|nr:hypothetical protein [Chthoniobacterales bacterium]
MNLAYHSARLEGKTVRFLYRAALPIIVRRKPVIPREIALEMFTYSGEDTLPEQIASIRSFLACVGRPKSVTVLSDGSHSAASIRLLERVDPSVRVCQSLPILPANLPDEMRTYLTTHPTGKQLALIMSLPKNGPALYVDSDVRFFPGASDLIRITRTDGVSAFYLADYQFSGDDRLLIDPMEKLNAANTGFLLLFRKLDWSLALQRLIELKGPPIFFTNQTVLHLCMRANGAAPFDPLKYILRVDDEFVYGDQYASPAVAMRHYVHQIRHKFWTALARRFPK